MHDTNDDDIEPGARPPADPVINSPTPNTGYKRPPENARFKTGKSGNPSGRPKGAKGQGPIVEKVLLEEHSVVERGRDVTRTALELIVLTLRNRAFEGDTKACKDLQKLLAKYDPNAQERVRGGLLVVPGRLTPEAWEAIFAQKSEIAF